MNTTLARRVNRVVLFQVALAIVTEFPVFIVIVSCCLEVMQATLWPIHGIRQLLCVLLSFYVASGPVSVVGGLSRKHLTRYLASRDGNSKALVATDLFAR